MTSSEPKNDDEQAMPNFCGETRSLLAKMTNYYDNDDDDDDDETANEMKMKMHFQTALL